MMFRVVHLTGRRMLLVGMMLSVLIAIGTFAAPTTRASQLGAYLNSDTTLRMDLLTTSSNDNGPCTDVTTFGARADDETDDTKAIQTAIWEAALGASPRTHCVLIPAGSFMIKGGEGEYGRSIFLPSEITIKGVRGKSKLIGTRPLYADQDPNPKKLDGGIFEIGSDRNKTIIDKEIPEGTKSHIVIKNLIFNGSKAVAQAIGIGGGSRGEVCKTSLAAPCATDVEILGNESSYFVNQFFRSAGWSNRIRLIFNYVHDNQIEQLGIIQTGISPQYLRDSVVAFNRIERIGYSPEVEEAGDWGIYACCYGDGISIYANTISDSAGGIKVLGMGNGGEFRNVLIEDNILHNVGANSIYAQTVEGLRVKNNIIAHTGRSERGYGQAAINIQSDVTNFEIVDNAIDLFQQGINGMALVEGNSNGLVTNNRITNFGRSGASTGIKVERSEHIRIQGNNVQGADEGIMLKKTKSAAVMGNYIELNSTMKGAENRIGINLGESVTDVKVLNNRIVGLPVPDEIDTTASLPRPKLTGSYTAIQGGENEIAVKDNLVFLSSTLHKEHTHVDLPRKHYHFEENFLYSGGSTLCNLKAENCIISGNRAFTHMKILDTRGDLNRYANFKLSDNSVTLPSMINDVRDFLLVTDVVGNRTQLKGCNFSDAMLSCIGPDGSAGISILTSLNNTIAKFASRSADDVYIGTTTANSTLNLGTDDRNHLTLSSKGNIGIGMTGPISKLHIQQEGEALANEFSSAHGLQIWGRDQDLQLGVDTSRRIAYLQSVDHETIVSNIALNPRGGNVGIGTVDPATRLDVRIGTKVPNSTPPQFQISEILRLQDHDTGAGLSIKIDPEISADPRSVRFDVDADGSGYVNVMTLQKSNVGIGTNTPLAKLHVAGEEIRLNKPCTPLPTGCAPALTSVSLTASGVLSTNGQHLSLNPSGGNVGIGTLNPQSTLHVNGYIQLALTIGKPPAGECSATTRGRMKVDSAEGILYICVNSGWISK